MRAILTCSVALLSVLAALGGAAAAGTGQVIERAQFVAPGPALAHQASIATTSDSPGACAQCQAGCESADGACGIQSGCGGCGSGCGSCCLGSTCDMGQRLPYFPPLHGYYYFRPYHHLHVRNHQALVQSWGEDPANPYANRVFQGVYQEAKAASQTPAASAAK